MTELSEESNNLFHCQKGCVMPVSIQDSTSHLSQPQPDFLATITYRLMTPRIFLFCIAFTILPVNRSDDSGAWMKGKGGQVYCWPLLLISQDSRKHRSLWIKINNQKKNWNKQKQIVYGSNVDLTPLGLGNGTSKTRMDWKSWKWSLITQFTPCFFL